MTLYQLNFVQFLRIEGVFCNVLFFLFIMNVWSDVVIGHFLLGCPPPPAPLFLLLCLFGALSGRAPPFPFHPMLFKSSPLVAQRMQ